MTDTLTPVLTAHWDQPDIFTIDGYRRAGGWQALPKALGMSRDEVITVVRNAGLRGRVLPRDQCAGPVGPHRRHQQHPGVQVGRDPPGDRK